MSRIVLEVERGKVATSSDMLMNMGGTLEGVLINALLVVGGCQGGNTTRGDFGRNQVGADTHMNPGRGGNLNPRFRNAGGGYKRGLDDRDGQVDQRDVDLRPKVRREVDARRVGTRGLSHCFNCNRDDHSQTSCLNPPPYYSCKKDS
jgi:hypothetical protein